MSPLLFTLQLEVQGQSWFNSLSPYPNLSFQVLKFSNVTWYSKNLKFYTTQNCFYCVYLSIKCFKPILSKYLLLVQSCPTLWDPMNYSLPSSSVHGILQARILEWVAISFSRGSSWPRNQTWVSCIAGTFCTNWTANPKADFIPVCQPKWRKGRAEQLWFGDLEKDLMVPWQTK